MARINRREFVRTAAIGGAMISAMAAGGESLACGFEKTAGARRLAPRWKEIAKWDREDFDALVGTPFDINGRMLVLQEIRGGPETPAQFREQFALVFESGKVDDLQGAIMPVRHPAIGKADLYVNIVRYMDTGMTAEIYFS